MKIIGSVFDSGLAFANTEDEVRNIIECTENVEMFEFPDEVSAYIWMIKTYENRGIARACLLPAPTLENLHIARFFSTEDPEILRQRNQHKSRVFILWNMGFYAIYRDIELVSEDFFLPNNYFLLKETASEDEAVKELFRLYASRVFPLYPYSGGTAIPMLGSQFAINEICKAPYVSYIANNITLPKELGQLNPTNNLVQISPPNDICCRLDNQKNDKQSKNTRQKIKDGGINDGTEQNRNQQD